MEDIIEHEVCCPKCGNYQRIGTEEIEADIIWGECYECGFVGEMPVTAD